MSALCCGGSGTESYDAVTLQSIMNWRVSLFLGASWVKRTSFSSWLVGVKWQKSWGLNNLGWTAICAMA